MILTTKSKGRILIVDDEEDLQELLRYNLEASGYDVNLAATGEEALEKARSASPDLILLDLMLPGIGGLDVCRKLRGDENTSGIPILMLTAKGEEEDIVAGLDMGADDYVTKPFSVSVLIARAQAILRRRSSAPSPYRIEIDGLVLDRERHEARLDGQRLDLTYSEYAILDTLIRRNGAVLTRQQIVAAIRSGEITVTDRSIDVHVTSIRKKLGDIGRRIITVRGVGYRFEAESV